MLHHLCFSLFFTMGNNQSALHHQMDLIPLLVMSMDPIVQGLVFFAVSEAEKAEKQQLEEEDDDARLVAAAADAAVKIF